MHYFKTANDLSVDVNCKFSVMETYLWYLDPVRSWKVHLKIHLKLDSSSESYHFSSMQQYLAWNTTPHIRAFVVLDYNPANQRAFPTGQQLYLRSLRCLMILLKPDWTTEWRTNLSGHCWGNSSSSSWLMNMDWLNKYRRSELQAGDTRWNNSLVMTPNYDGWRVIYSI